jgi:CheY-like chemotaxis protein
LPLRFEVEDSGMGIAPADLDLIFEPFIQTLSGRHSQEGTGLGLPISRQFVHLLGGDLAVSSQIDVGSTFGFEIPVQVIDAAVVTPTDLPRRVLAIAPAQPEYRILVAEDNWANRVLLHNLLTDLGFAVQTAATGQAAVEQWQTWHPHLIFMDIRMPVLDGYEATEAIRQQEQALRLRQPHLPLTKIISLTAGVSYQKQTNFDQLGFDGLIGKPIQEAEITRTLAQHLGVRYVYEAEALMPESTTTDPSPYLTAELLQELSIDWIEQFHNALIRLNQDQMMTLIAAIPAEQASIAQVLSHKIQNFDYEVLLDLTQSILEPTFRTFRWHSEN